MPRSAGESAMRRKMRKGTHSCFECRRRKIRCIFPPDNPDVCSECFARGSRCVDQEHADSDVVLDQRKNLRERVARLESLVDTLMDDRSERGAAEALSTLRTDAFSPSPISSQSALDQQGSNSAPLLAMFDNDVIRRDHSPSVSTRPTSDSPGQPNESQTTAPTSEGAPTVDMNACCPRDALPSDQNGHVNQALKAKQEKTRKALLATLPSREKMMQIFRENGSWWGTWRSKTPGTCGPHMSLVEFAERVLQTGTIGELGTLALSYGVCLEGDEVDKYLALTERVVTSDDDYGATLEGMECMILQCKVYADIGQPRRAWLSIRKGLMYAQLMGLHRNHAMSPASESIWWSLYQSDRFLSLMLGTPYGISDAHCNFSFPTPEGVSPSRNATTFIIKASQIAGRVIDRTQSLADQSYSTALDLDQELEGLRAQLPPGWWDVNAGSLHIPTADLRERLLMQICYHQIRVYLHLPFMLKSPGDHRFEFSRVACFEASREMLSLYHQLRSSNGEPLYECKAVDFIGFTGAIVLLLGLLGYGRFAPVQDPAQDEKDWRLIEICMDIFRRASSEKGGRVAAQSFRVLEQLSGVRNKDPAELDAHRDRPGKVVIPYFGTISVRTGSKFTHPNGKPRELPTRGPSGVGGPQRPAPSADTSFGQSSANGIRGDSGFGAAGFGFPTAAATSSTSSQANCTPGSGPDSMDDPFIAYDGMYMMPSVEPHSNFMGAPLDSGGGFQPSQQQQQQQQDLWPSPADTQGFGAEQALGSFPALGSSSFNAQGLGPAVMDIDQDWGWWGDMTGGLQQNGAVGADIVGPPFGS